MARVGAGRPPKALGDPAPLTTARAATRGQAHGQNKEAERPVLGRAPLCGRGEGERRLPRWASPPAWTLLLPRGHGSRALAARSRPSSMLTGARLWRPGLGVLCCEAQTPTSLGRGGCAVPAVLW